MNAEKLSWLTASIPESCQHFQTAPQHDADLFIDTVRHVDVRLLRISRKRHVPHGSGSQRVLVEEGLFYKRAVLPEDLHTIIDAIADIDKSILGNIRAVDGIELLRRRIGGTIRRNR